MPPPLWRLRHSKKLVKFECPKNGLYKTISRYCETGGAWPCKGGDQSRGVAKVLPNKSRSMGASRGLAEGAISIKISIWLVQHSSRSLTAKFRVSVSERSRKGWPRCLAWQVLKLLLLFECQAPERYRSVERTRWVLRV